MGYNNSPLENLAAFAIAFLAGAMSAAGLAKYIDKIKKDRIYIRGSE